MTTPNEAQTPATDIDSAAAKVAGLLDMSDDGDASEMHVPEPEEFTDDEVSSGDEAPDESRASQDESEETDPVSETPIIEAPQSWSAEEKAKFKELPSELQQVVARRESERDKAISQRMNQIAQERKAIEAHVQQAQAVHAQNANALQQLLVMTLPELQKVDQTNWEHLASTDPSEYVRLQAVRDGLIRRVNLAQQQLGQIQAQNQQVEQQRQQARLAEQFPLIVQRVPEFADVQSPKAQALISDINSTAAKFGFTPDEVAGTIGDARIVHVLARLAQFEKADEARKSAQSKKSTAQAPRMIPTSAAPVREDNQNRKVADQWKTLRHTGSARDAARLIENIL